MKEPFEPSASGGVPAIDSEVKSQAAEKKQYDYVIVGGGVAGVLSAEMLLRSGKSVLLIEKEKKIATKSSGEQHGWGQFGYLYLNADDPGVAEACLQNIDILTDSYPMPGNNLISDKTGQLVSNDPQANESWYRADPVYYYYPTPTEGSLNLDAKEQKAWEKKLHNVLLRTQAISEEKWNKTVDLPTRKLPDYNEQAGNKLFVAKKAAKTWMTKTATDEPSGKIAQRLARERADTTVPTDVVIESHDRPMRSTHILASIYNRFQRKGGKTALDTEIKDYNVVGDIVKLTTDKGETITADKVIFTAGGGLHDIKGSNVNTVLSPLLIVSPPVCNRNLVYLTPKTQLTINHLHHVDPVSGKAYSIIGNGDGIKPEDTLGIEKSRANILAQAGQIFPKLESTPDQDKTVYFGYKTEFLEAGKERNYHYAFNPIDEQSKVWAAVPGKFTLAPSLAKHIYQKLEGGNPPSESFTEEEATAYRESIRLQSSTAIAQTLHSQVVGERIGSDDYPIEQRQIRSKLAHPTKPIENPLATEGVAIQNVDDLVNELADIGDLDAISSVVDQQSQTVNPSSEKGVQIAALRKEMDLLRNPTPSNEDDELERSSTPIPTNSNG